MPTDVQSTEKIENPAADAAAANANLEGGAPEVDAEDEYDKLFNEVVAKREAEKAGTAEPTPDPIEHEATPAGDGEQAEAEAGAEKPADAPKKEGVKAIEPDWVKELPAAKRADAMAAIAAAAEAATLKDRLAKVEHDNRSMVGRVSAYQRKYEEAVGRKKPDAAEADKAEASAEWNQFKEDYPDIAKAIESRVPATAGTDDAVVEFVRNEMRSRQLNDAYEAVDAVHPKWREEVRTKEFAEWKATSPTYERLASSDDVADAVALFDLWESHRSKAAPRQQTPDPEAVAAATKLAARRGAQVDGGKAAVTKSASPNQNVDMNDEDQLFAFYANQANARMRKRNS